MLHLTNRFLVFLFGKLVQAPLLEHAVVQKILVNRGELVFELRLKGGDDFGVALHKKLLEL